MRNFRTKIQSWDLIPGNVIEEASFDRDNGTLGLLFEEQRWAEFESTDPQMSVYFMKVEKSEDGGEERRFNLNYEDLRGKIILQMIVPFGSSGYDGIGFIWMRLSDNLDVILRSEVDNVPIRLS